MLMHCGKGFEERTKVYLDVIDLHVPVIHLLPGQIFDRKRSLTSIPGSLDVGSEARPLPLDPGNGTR